MSWIEEVDESLKPYLKALIKDTQFNKKAFLESSNKGLAQLWISQATLYKQVVTLDNRIKLLEKMLREFTEKK